LLTIFSNELVEQEVYTGVLPFCIFEKELCLSQLKFIASNCFLKINLNKDVQGVSKRAL
jgi:hypothetical protein